MLMDSKTQTPLTQTLLGFVGGENGKICGKGMSIARQVSRRFGRAKGAKTRSAADYCINATMSVKSDPFKS